ncbi:MAG: hypothetical protein AB8B81_21660 [Halioglobus sp.]
MVATLSAGAMMITPQYVSAAASVGFLAAYCLGYWLALSSTNWGIVGVLLHGAGLFFVYANIVLLCVHLIGVLLHMRRQHEQRRKHLVSAVIIAAVLVSYYGLIYNGVYLSA